jgi:hypothetical protein
MLAFFVVCVIFCKNLLWIDKGALDNYHRAS